MVLNEEMVHAALTDVVDPDLQIPLSKLDAISEVLIEGGSVRLKVNQAVPGAGAARALRESIQAAMAKTDLVTEVQVDVELRVQPSRGAGTPNNQRIPQVKNIIAVGSGKGGVGKSTVAVNLAVSLARSGAKTGLLDADIYGPSLPTMLGLKGQTPLLDQTNKKLIPMDAHDLKVMSMGFMLKETDAVVWRGPMLGKALQQFLDDVIWGELDYLVVDLPPGTGDVQLSLAQLIPVSGAVVVTTPQDVAHADVQRAVRMFEMLKTPIIGLVENMSHFVCPDNEKTYHIFGEGRTERFAESVNLPLLQTLPIDLKVAPSGDKGIPVVSVDPKGEQAKLYAALAHRTAAELGRQAMDSKKKNKAESFFKMQPGS